MPRPSSPLGAKASTKCPLLLDTRISPQPSLARRPLIPHATPSLFGPGRRRLDFRILIKTRRSVRSPVARFTNQSTYPLHDVTQRHPSRCSTWRITPRETRQTDPRQPGIQTDRHPDNDALNVVEADGIEPTTPCLQSRCSPTELRPLARRPSRYRAT